LDDLGETCRAHAGGEAARKQHCRPERQARCKIDGEDACGEGAEPKQSEGKSREGGEDDGDDRKRPDPRLIEPLGKKIRHRIAAEIAQEGRDQKGNGNQTPACAERKERRAIPISGERDGKAGKSEHRKQSGSDRGAVEYRRYKTAGDIEVGDRTPERHRPGPGVERSR
jgi:hypothetical protein